MRYAVALHILCTVQQLQKSNTRLSKQMHDGDFISMYIIYHTCIIQYMYIIIICHNMY